MKNNSDYIVCFIDDNESIKINKNIDNVQELEIRINNVKKYVNEIIIVKSSDPTIYLKEFIQKNEYKYDFKHIRGNDSKNFPGIDYIKEKNINILYKKYTSGI